ncbi:MAG TPA: hypothetical protein H9758_03565 [Candidatus Mediterraneibacter faecipullorum]|uniref:Uncharacterized protein n=1 Tax=Candidatus Mediterraneibacter faecipullorum TaxID=2838670 RepID=A0A9D2NKX8_9FIRM|nr:hypothetical protein [Candidatus Mediterraneibacter faecipullorum]
MKCPICGKELELRNKQIGTNENGDPIFNEYAICRDCKKQWNLDKQRAKRAAAKKAAQEASAKKNEASAQETTQTREVQIKEAASKKEAPVKKAAPKQNAPEAKAAPEGKTAPKRKAPAGNPAVRQEKPVRKSSAQDAEAAKKPAPKRRPRPVDETVSEEHAKKPVRRRRPEEAGPAEEKRYSNIPSEKVRAKHEKAARKSYGEMLETGTIDKKAVNKKKKKQLEDETGEIKRNRNYEAEADEYDDDEYYDDDPRFRPLRIILGILSLIGFGYLIYRGFVTGLADTTEGGTVSSGMTYVILALCMLVSALLYFIMQRKNTIFAFLLPMVFYLGSAVFAFIQRGDDLQLLIAAIAGAVLAVISLILAITSRGGGYDDEEEDYDDAFEDDYADDDYDD